MLSTDAEKAPLTESLTPYQKLQFLTERGVDVGMNLRENALRLDELS
jgi:hypothetical protein